MNFLSISEKFLYNVNNASMITVQRKSLEKFLNVYQVSFNTNEAHQRLTFFMNVFMF